MINSIKINSIIRPIPNIDSSEPLYSGLTYSNGRVYATDGFTYASFVMQYLPGFEGKTLSLKSKAFVPTAVDQKVREALESKVELYKQNIEDTIVEFPSELTDDEHTFVAGHYYKTDRLKKLATTLSGIDSNWKSELKTTHIVKKSMLSEQRVDALIVDTPDYTIMLACCDDEKVKD